MSNVPVFVTITHTDAAGSPPLDRAKAEAVVEIVFAASPPLLNAFRFEKPFEFPTALVGEALVITDPNPIK